jgi:uncharacterized protein YbdZ (MbtH family)
MDKISALSRGTQVMLASSVLLLIDTFFKWQKVSFDFGPVSGSVGRSGWHGFWGVVLGLLTIAAIVWLVVRIVQPDVVAMVPAATAALALGALILLFAVLKNLIDDYSAWPSYVGIVLAAGVAAGGWLIAQESGGTEAAMAWRPSGMGSSSSTPPPTTPEPPPASTPPPPPPAATDEPPPPTSPPAEEP